MGRVVADGNIAVLGELLGVHAGCLFLDTAPGVNDDNSGQLPGRRRLRLEEKSCELN